MLAFALAFAVPLPSAPGLAIEEALHDPDKLDTGEQLIWPIINFDKTVYYGVNSNPLQTIAEIVNRKIGEKIQQEIVRKDEEYNSHYLNITLIPHQWSGQGVLG